MKIKHIQSSLIILFLLIAGSFSLHSYAEEKSITAKNIFLDSDQDGLSDEEEKAYGTDPRKADSDNDGYSDGAEVKSGYNPLKPSPGDKIIPKENSPSPQNSNEKNLTKEMAQKVSAIIKNSEAENKEVTLDQIKSAVSESLQEKTSSNDLPEIDKKEIKIKKQNYAKLSKEKQFEKKKEDFEKYVAAISYVFLSNSPKPINSNTDLENLQLSVQETLLSALSNQNSSSLDELSESGEKMLSQIKDVEVPEEFVESHVKGLRFALYTSQLKNSINPNPSDPLADLVNYSKIQSLIISLSDFSKDIQSQVEKYDISLDDQMKENFKNYGVTVPDGFLEETQ